MRVCIILPTYNERENLPRVLETLNKEFLNIKEHTFNILVVDDNSPDKTYEIAKKYSEKCPHIKLLMRERKEGLGAAYIAGMIYAIELLNADIVFEMDADLSHDSKEIQNFMKEIEGGHDFVIGSRYISGGNLPNWPVRRKIISKTGNLLARMLAGIYRVKDCTSGYRAIRVDLLKQINLNNLKVSGYSFQMNLLHAATKKSAKIKEIPITFFDRKEGHSKLTKKDMFEYFINSFKLRFRSY